MAINALQALEWFVKSIYKMRGGESGECKSLLVRNSFNLFSDFIEYPELMRAVYLIRKVIIYEPERILWQELGTKEDYEHYLRREQMTADIFLNKAAQMARVEMLYAAITAA